MKRLHYFLFGLIVASGIGLSYFVIPDDGEMAFIYFKDRDFDQAKEAFERRLAANDQSVSVVVPLSQLYLQYADIDRAIGLMKQFVERNPRNLEALRQLAKYYQYAQRQADYVTTLERITDVESSGQNLRDLASNYNFLGQYDKQIAVLKRLVASPDRRAQDYLDLAYLEAAAQRLPEAISAVQQFENRFPEAITPDTVELYLNLLLDAGRAKDAVTRAALFLAEDGTPAGAASLVALFHYKQQPRLALTLIGQFESAIDREPALLNQWVQLHVALGRPRDAFDRLQRLRTEGRLISAATESFLDVALNVGERQIAVDASRTADVNSFPAWLQLQLVRTAHEIGDKAYAQDLAHRVGDRCFQEDPAFAATLAEERGDMPSLQRWLALAEASPSLDLSGRVALAHFYLRSGRSADAHRILDSIHAAPASDAEVIDLANLYLQLDPAAGARRFDSWKAKLNRQPGHEEWARLMAAGGETAPVEAWISMPDDIRVEVLMDVFYTAQDRKEWSLALAAAGRLWSQRKGREDRFRLAVSLVSSGRPAEALPHLRNLLSPGGSPIEGLQETYHAALIDAHRAGHPVAEELRAVWRSKLDAAGVDDAQSTVAVYALLELQDYSQVLPVLEKLAAQSDSSWLFAYVDAAVKAGKAEDLNAFLNRQVGRTDLAVSERETRLRLLIEHGGYASALSHLRQFADTAGGDWVGVYEEALSRLDRRRDLIQFWTERAARESLSDVERRALGFRVLEAGQKSLAESIFEKLARSAPPQSPDVAQLMFLWGPRPPARGVTWLAARARSARDAELGAWLEHLNNTGSAKRTLELAGSDFARVTDHEKSFDAFANGLSLSRDADTAARWIQFALQRETVRGDDRRVRRLAQLASEFGIQDLAVKAWRRLLVLVPDSREAQRRLGIQALFLGQYGEAEKLLSVLVANEDSDPETYFYFGELVTRKHGAGAARRHFERALSLFAKIRAPGVSERIISAQILDRLGRFDEAAQAFEDLLRERPEDSNLRADYASLLIQRGRYGDAERILEHDAR